MVNLKVFVLITTIGLLPACVDINSLNIAKAEYLCRKEGGLYKLKNYSLFPVVCKNGKRFSRGLLGSVIIKDESYLPKGEIGEN